MADAAYDSAAIRAAIAGKNARAVIPNNPSRAQRNDIEKTARSILAVVMIAAIVLWLR